jgi:hypothetical protein
MTTKITVCLNKESAIRFKMFDANAAAPEG